MTLGTCLIQLQSILKQEASENADVSTSLASMTLCRKMCQCTCTQGQRKKEKVTAADIKAEYRPKTHVVDKSLIRSSHLHTNTHQHTITHTHTHTHRHL